LRSDELHTAFNFDFLACPWDAARLRSSIEATLRAHAPVAAPATWVLSNHDVTRPVTRYGRADTSFSFAAKRPATVTDLVLGRRRARAAALLAMALPGALYIYQGDELGLPEVEDIPASQLADPMHFRSGGVDPGRDGCRVPLPWSGARPPFGFSPEGARPWLPQPSSWRELTAEVQAADPASTLSLYRSALAVRARDPALRNGSLTWLPGSPEVLAFRRADDFACMVNLSPELQELPADVDLILTSTAFDGRWLPPDTAVWLRL
jgi:alpha-glucosidase